MERTKKGILMCERMRRVLALLATWWAVLRHERDPRFVAKRIPEPIGLGDTVHNWLEWWGIGRRVRSYFASLNQDCGCERRRRWLNLHAHPWVWWVYPIPKKSISYRLDWTFRRKLIWWLLPLGLRATAPFLTFALPHKNDWEGVWSTVNAIVKDCITAGILDKIEIVILDQGEGGRDKDGKPLDELFELRDAANAKYQQKVMASRLVENFAGRLRGVVRVVSYTETEGPSGATNAIFMPLAVIDGKRMPAARGEFVIRADCHVEFDPGVIRNVFKFCVRNRFTRDIYTGPHRMAVGHGPMMTHTDMTWGGQMLGKWQHDPRGDDPNGKPFAIENLSGGMVLCRRDAWAMYHPLNVGFGAGQGAIGLKVRKRGNQLMCLPALVWIHRYGRSVKMPLRNDSSERVANYAREFAMIGAMDEIERMRTYYLEVEERDAEGNIKKSRWPAERFDGIVAKAIMEHEQWVRNTDPSGIEAHFRHAVAKPSDLNEHLVTLRRLASQCEHITEFAKTYQTSTLAFLAGGIGKLVNISPYDCPGCQANFIDKIRGRSEFVHLTADSKAIPPIETTDLLFIDSEHHAKQLRAELALHADSVRTWIVLHDTAKFGVKGSDKGAGLLIALDEFLAAHPEWSIVERYEFNHGLIVLQRGVAANVAVTAPRDEPNVSSGILERIEVMA